MAPIKLMILSDAPSSRSGLGRITRELAILIDYRLHDRFQVATLGLAGIGSKEFPWPQYAIISNPLERGRFLPDLYHAWNDFAGDERGVLLTIWDADRLAWLTDPETRCPDPVMKSWLLSRPFELWGYWPVDTAGVNGNLPHGFADVMKRYDRNLAYSHWASGVMAREGVTAEVLPHGIDTLVWYPRSRKHAREKMRRLGMLALGNDSLLLGVVAANQPRKDWALAFETAALLLKHDNDVLVWGHTDAIRRYWDLNDLALDFGLKGRVFLTQPPAKDEELAEFYSACDVTLGIGLGEGFGYPIFESLACGTPCLHGNYGGAAEHLANELLINPVALRYEANCNCCRPVFDAQNLASKVERLKTQARFWELPVNLDWNTLWPSWEQWLLAGVRESKPVTEAAQ